MKRMIAKWLLWRSDVAERKTFYFAMKAGDLFDRAKALLGETRK